MSVTRRAFLGATAGSVLGYPLALRAGQAASRIFSHGVASGDPLATAVVIWTRVTPPAGAANARIRVRWQVTTDSERPVVVRAGTATTSAQRDHTVKVDVEGLEPGRTYNYRFEALGDASPTGRTRTLALDTSHVRLAVVSCSNYPAGYFNAYAAIARREDVDVILHLGDYIYEFANGVFGDGTGIGRVHQPDREATSLDDYRGRYATYRSDPDLQELHRLYPFIAVWDDHEFASNAWAGGVDGWAARRQAAMRAYLEWIPVRERGGGDFHLYRSFAFGNLATLAMLDTRSLRDGQVFATDMQGLADPRRRLMGARQEQWLSGLLHGSKAAGTTWSLIGQQVMFSPFTTKGLPIKNPDAWDGYQAEQARVRDLFAAVGNVAVLTGDMHSSWAFDVPRDPWDSYNPDSGAGSIAVELIAPAVSSQPYFTGDQKDTLGPSIVRSLPHLKFLEGEHRGYLILDVTPTRLEATWFLTPDVGRRSPEASLGATFVVEAGRPRLVAG
ncbi:MAG: alkaline phosphatase D family protein [Vicinamibacterales bacterium]